MANFEQPDAAATDGGLIALDDARLPTLHRRPTQTDIERARHEFFELARRPAGLIHDRIVASWTRCTRRGLQADKAPSFEPLTDSQLRAARRRSEALLRLAEPELQFLQESVEDSDSLIVLTDASGLILDTRGDGAFLSRAERLALLPGVGWGETERGTNAIGTALAENHLIEVWGGEHFHHKHRVLCCTAAPIVDPTGQVLGLIDVSGDARLPRGYARAVVKRAVREIEYRAMLHAPSHLTVLRMHSDRVCLGSYQEGVLWLDDQRIVGANRHALRWLGCDWSLIGKAWNQLFFSPLPQQSGQEALLVTTRGDRLVGLTELRKPGGVGARRAGVPVEPPTTAPMNAPPPERGLAPVAAWFDERTHLQLQRATKAVDAGLAVMILGETGAGKEVFARALHRASRRAHGPFVAVNCAAFPEHLIESELFGYEEGAFTGARKQGIKGRVQQADGGILFLDEIGDMPLAMQTRLLRVLQERAVAPLGGGQPRTVDIAVLCATHRDLPAMVQNRQFRADLYYRLEHVVVTLPAWRELSSSERLACFDALWQASGAQARRITLQRPARQLILQHDWAGNLRQLSQLLTTLVVLAEPGDTLGIYDLPADLQPHVPVGCTVADSYDRPDSGALPSSPPRPLKTITRDAIVQALDQAKGNVATAAMALGVHRTTLYRQIRAMGHADGR